MGVVEVEVIVMMVEELTMLNMMGGIDVCSYEYKSLLP